MIDAVNQVVAADLARFKDLIEAATALRSLRPRLPAPARVRRCG